MSAIDNIAISKKGRPSTEGTPIMVRVGPELLAGLDAYRKRCDDLPSRPEAIRRLVENGLATE